MLESYEAGKIGGWEARKLRGCIWIMADRSRKGWKDRMLKGCCHLSALSYELKKASEHPSFPAS
jgi:hypothetical protein